MHTTRHISRAARGATSGRGPGAAVAGALALLLLGAGGQAGADEGAGTGTSARDTALDFIAGAPRTWYDLSATVGLDAAYDSNVYNGRGPDEVTRVSPRLALALHDRRNELKLSYDLGYWVYALGKADSSVNHRAQASYDVQATRRLAFRLADEFTRAQDPGFLTRTGVVAPQTGITDNVTAKATIPGVTSEKTSGVRYTPW